MAQEKCWELRAGCECNGTPQLESGCPPYRAGMSCWEFDWLTFYNDLPSGRQEIWSYELRKCVNCFLFSRFDEEMRLNIILLKESFPHD